MKLQIVSTKKFSILIFPYDIKSISYLERCVANIDVVKLFEKRKEDFQLKENNHKNVGVINKYSNHDPKKSLQKNNL